MYAFATLHHYYHEFGYNGRLSGYEIGEGFMDPAEEEELQKSLLLAKRYISAALDLDVLFGDHGIDFLKQLTRGQLEAGLKSADLVLQALECKGYSFIGLSLSIAQVACAMDLFSTVINSYQGFRDKYLLTEDTSVWRAAKHIHSQDDGPIFPAAIESHAKKGSA